LVQHHRINGQAGSAVTDKLELATIPSRDDIMAAIRSVL
jgi:hypothetical protein